MKRMTEQVFALGAFDDTARIHDIDMIADLGNHG